MKDQKNKILLFIIKLNISGLPSKDQKKTKCSSPEPELDFWLFGLVAYWFLGFWVSWILGFLVSWLLGFSAYWLLAFLASWLLGFLDSWLLGLLVASWLCGSRLPEVLAFWLL